MLDFRETETETSCKPECFEHRSLMSRLRSHKIALQSPTIVKMLFLKSLIIHTENSKEINV